MKNAFKTIPMMLAVSLFLLSACDKDDDDPIVETTYTDVMSTPLKSDLVDDASITPYEAIFDVSPAYDQGHLPFATNTGGVDGLENMLDGLDKNRSYLVYCHSDAPSIAGAELLVENGFSNVHRLQGNYGAWDDVSFVDIAAAVVKAKIDAGDFEAIFDVSPHFSEGHLPGAMNANASAGGTDLSELIAGMDNSKTYLVYCHADGPAMAGAQLMEDAGFENVYRLEGNFGAWVNAGYDVETPTTEKLYTDVMAGQLKSELVDDASISPYDAIFDVSPYYAQGHLPFATNAGSVEGLGTMLDGLDKNLKYLVYCHADGPSIAGAQLMAENGFTNVYRLEGNYGAWDNVSFADIAAADAKTKIEAGDFKAIFDVSPYFSDGHLPGATNANAGAGGTSLSELIAGMDKTKSYLVYCHADSPAMAGAQLMEDAGFENVYRLEGNYGAWKDAGYDVEK
ncbi:rhodanese-like domain-containing protein [Maribellus mangrovi]|uniref:rhodanese-like domain-containing protein n=1 Tax=Maribellus mangrovi TaxID=3133146 RepID=UPI0030ECA846